MKWQGGRRSGNIEDRRGMSGGGAELPLKGGIRRSTIVLSISYFMTGCETCEPGSDQMQTQGPGTATCL